LNTTTKYNYVDVVLPLSLRQFYSYSIPEEIRDEVELGKRVVVQFGKSKLYSAIVIKIHNNKPSAYETKAIEYVIVAGAGGGRRGGGAGAGGYRSSVSGESSGGGASAESSPTCSAATYSVVVGAGGEAAQDSLNAAGDGNVSSFIGGSISISSTGVVLVVLTLVVVEVVVQVVVAVH
jgi:hypothetical protein